MQRLIINSYAYIKQPDPNNKKIQAADFT